MSRLKTKGTIALIGGAEDKKRDKQVLKHIAAINAAQQVAVIPTASNYPSEVYENYYRAFKDLGLKEIFRLDIRYPSEADKSEYHEMIQNADLIFFTGGDQERLVEIVGESKLLTLIKRRLTAGATLAGTSAGASAIGDPLMVHGNDLGGFKKGSINVSRGFGILKSIIIDTHFLMRNRIPRLVQILASKRCKPATPTS